MSYFGFPVPSNNCGVPQEVISPILSAADVSLHSRPCVCFMEILYAGYFFCFGTWDIRMTTEVYIYMLVAICLCAFLRRYQKKFQRSDQSFYGPSLHLHSPHRCLFLKKRRCGFCRVSIGDFTVDASGPPFIAKRQPGRFFFVDIPFFVFFSFVREDEREYI